MKASKIGGVVKWSQGTIILRAGQTIDPDHPIVAERPELFRDADEEAEVKAPAPAVERGTRAPGEVRNTPGTGPKAGRVPVQKPDPVQ